MKRVPLLIRNQAGAGSWLRISHLQYPPKYATNINLGDVDGCKWVPTAHFHMSHWTYITMLQEQQLEGHRPPTVLEVAVAAVQGGLISAGPGEATVGAQRSPCAVEKALGLGVRSYRFGVRSPRSSWM